MSTKRKKIKSAWQKQKKVWQASFLALLSCGFLIAVWILPAVSAERIAFSYGIFGEFYVSIADLEIFAKEGKVTPSFNFYAARVNDENLAQLRDLLNRHFNISQVTVSTFLNLPIGEQLTKEIGLIIDSPTKISLPALRSALVLAAAQPKGLTILNVLRFYSTKTLKLNTARIIKAVNRATELLADTERVFTALKREAAVRAKSTSAIEPDTLANLVQLGSKTWRKETLIIELANYRQTEGIVYLPVATKKPAPVVVIAPGLNTDWQNFTYLAEHLASYGFGVATLNFPGTNAQRVNDVLNGLDTPPDDNQWIEQPKVVTQLLDEIERKSRSDRTWQGKLNLQRVGIIGQSLGGYTSMAIAGAKVDWRHLQQECRKIENPQQLEFNPALFWQCQNSLAAPPTTNLLDKRIIAAIAVNPVTNPVFSQKAMERLKFPLMIIAGDKDFFAPALDEQIVPFTWLPNIDKYLILVKNSTHFSFIGGGSDPSESSSQIVGSATTLAYSYLKVLSLAFFKAYLAEPHFCQSLQRATPQCTSSQFAPYLTEPYLESISQKPLPISLLRSLDASELKRLIEE